MSCRMPGHLEPSPWKIQRSTLNPKLPFHPISAKPIMYNTSGIQFLLTYMDPIKTMQMVNRQINWSINHAVTNMTKGSLLLQLFHQPLHTKDKHLCQAAISMANNIGIAHKSYLSLVCDIFQGSDPS